MHIPLATSIMDPNAIHRPIAQKMVSQHRDRFWMSYCFDDSCRLQMNLGLRLVPLEASWNYLSIHIKNVQNRLRMRPGHWFSCRLLLDSEMNSNLIWASLWRLKSDKLRASISIWISMLVSSVSMPFFNCGRTHGGHVLIIHSGNTWRRRVF